MAKKDQIPRRRRLSIGGRKGLWRRPCPQCGGPINIKRSRQGRSCAACEKGAAVAN